MHTPTGTPSQGGGMYKFPSVSSIHSMVSMGYLPPGHGYIPKKAKPDKPYGPTFVSVMNRTWRGPGRKYIHYALICLGISIVFFTSAALYFGHRNVARLVVLRTEVFGAIFIFIALASFAAMFQLIAKARVESNRWRADVKFHSEGLFTAAAVNYAYVPPEEVKLSSGTYGVKAMKEIPKPKGRGLKSKAPSLTNLRQNGPPPSSQGRIFEKRQQQQGINESRPDIYTVDETAEEPVTAKANGNQSDKSSSNYDEAYHEAATIARVPAEPQRLAETTQRAAAASRKPSIPITTTLPPPAQRPSPQQTPTRTLPPPAQRPSPQQTPTRTLPPPAQRPSPHQATPAARPSPQAWKAAGATPQSQMSTPSTSGLPQRPSPAQWSAQSLPPVSRGPVTSLKSPQPTIQIRGTTPKKGPMGESEL